MVREKANRLAVVIPAYRPSAALVEVVRALVERQFPAILVVDDGSGPEFHRIFADAGALPGVQLLRHATNLGKGAALKTGINHALCTIPDLAGVVTADADGQHDPVDIERVAEALVVHPQSLVLGCRAFHEDVPLRSRFGNILTSAVMHAMMGRKMADTQTGLRGLPASFALRTMKIEATGYEFELEMLIAAHQLGIGVVEESIRTIYEPGNRSSHFNPIVDSMKIYFVLLRFGSVSLLTALLDNLIFYLAYRHGGHILASQALGRLFAVSFNYSMVRSSVFYTHQPHRKVLPKYLLLVLASGTASYGGIRLLSTTIGINPVSAKLVVETVLFFVNFAVQRLFIFKPDGAVAAPAERQPPRAVPTRLVSTAVVLISLGVLAMEVYGFRAGNLFSQEIWLPIGIKRFTRFIGMYLGVSVPVLLLLPWSFAGLIAGLAAVGTAVSVGPQALLAVTFFLVSSCALGSRLLGPKHGDDTQSQLFSTLLGMAVWIFLMYCLARLPVNYAAAWAVLLAIPILLDLRGAWRRLTRWVDLLRTAELRRPGERAAFAILVFFLLAHWFVALMPETGADGLAMHLAIPANIAANHALTYQPNRFLWAVMPMGADFTYTITYLLGGEYAARLIDFTMLLGIEALLYYAMRRWLTRGATFLLMALFATTPLVQLVTGSLFVENLMTAMILGLMAAIWRFGDSGEKRLLYVAAVLGGTALATKFGAIPFVALALPFAVWEAARHRKVLGNKPAVVGALAVVLLLAAALPPYAIAYSKTGNPLFPFLYDKIPSPLLPADAGLVDHRFLRPLTWNTPFDLTFHSSKTYEGQDGSFGFQYLLLAPLAVVAILFLRRRPAVSAGVVALGASFLIMRSQPNARYLYTALPLLSVTFAALLGWAADHRRLYRALIAFVVACIAINSYFLPSSSYYHKDFCLRLPFSRAERDRFRAEAVPVREVIAYYNRAHPNSTVLMASESAIAGLNGTIYENHWQQYHTLMSIRHTLNVPDMVRLMQSWGVEYFIASKPAVEDDVKPAALREMLERCTEAEYELGNQYLAHLQPACRPQQARAAVVVSAGFYDDFDPALIFRGDWTKSTNFDGPDRHTISYSDIPGSEAQIVFEGRALTYAYTKAPNRGLAEVIIDGISQSTVDLYSPDIEWQTHTRFCCFTAGKHVAVIRVVGRANPKSAGRFIDLDSFTVE
ncbi:MAG: glycosyltransferase [Bryobacteraceae bacterium]|jgi:glycosyltransferase involved in cell wall biosynthesis